MESFNFNTLLEQLTILPNKTTIESKFKSLNMTGILIASTCLDIELDSKYMSIDEFIEFAKQYNSNIYYNIKPFNKFDFIISEQSLGNPTISDYISVLSENNEDIFEMQLYNSYNKTDTDIIDTTDILTVDYFIRNDSDIDEDDFLDEELNAKSKHILEDIKKFNDNIPSDIEQYTQQLTFMCIIDNQKIGIIYNNDYQLDTEVCLAEILHKYTVDYNMLVKQYKEEKQRIIEETRIKKQLAEKQLEQTLLTDINFAICTNQKMRKAYAENLYKNDLYKPILLELFGENCICSASVSTLGGILRNIPEHLDYRCAKQLEDIIEIIFRTHKDELKLLQNRK